MIKVKTILIVEDELDAGEMLKLLLESKDFKVTYVSDSTKAVETLKAGQFDLMITDIMMPKLNGFDLISLVRQDKNLKEMRIMAVTAIELSNEKLENLNNHQVTVVKKPYDQEFLLTKIG